MDNASLEDTAEFTVKAKNESGEISETFSLIVQCKYNYLLNFKFKTIILTKHLNSTTSFN